MFIGRGKIKISSDRKEISFCVYGEIFIVMFDDVKFFVREKEFF